MQFFPPSSQLPFTDTLPLHMQTHNRMAPDEMSRQSSISPQSRCDSSAPLEVFSRLKMSGCRLAAEMHLCCLHVNPLTVDHHPPGVSPASKHRVICIDWKASQSGLKLKQVHADCG